jgi:hypothetical protein
LFQKTGSARQLQRKESGALEEYRLVPIIAGNIQNNLIRGII